MTTALNTINARAPGPGNVPVAEPNGLPTA
jgi:hypothetical protein